MANLITIEQLLESVDLDFEPRFVTKDGNGDVYIFEDTPEIYKPSKVWVTTVPASGLAGYESLKLTEFADKDWQECIYEVPRKTTGKIEKIVVGPQERFEPVLKRVIDTLNAVVDAVNEINENYACIAALTDIRKRLDTLEKCVKNKRGEE